MGGQNSKGGSGGRAPSSSLHLRDKKELAGVGVIFRKSPEGTKMFSLPVSPLSRPPVPGRSLQLKLSMHNLFRNTSAECREESASATPTKTS